MNKIIIILLIFSYVLAEKYIVDQKNKSFYPENLTVKVGDTIIFKNSDQFAHHTYTDDLKNEFDNGLQASGENIEIKIKAKSRLFIECAIHPNMILEVNVK